jgi:hypothetical protein
MLRLRVGRVARFKVAPAGIGSNPLIGVSVSALMRVKLLTLPLTVAVANVAVTVCALVTLTVHAPVPPHPPPLQPWNTFPAAGLAVSVTAVPFA